MREALSLARIAFPMILTGLLLYSRSMISMLFLDDLALAGGFLAVGFANITGYSILYSRSMISKLFLGDLTLAGGFLAVGFANITGYSILSGLAIGMEPICGQAFGAKKFSLLGLTLQRTVLLLTALPISLLWLNMERILLFCRQDAAIAAVAQTFLLYSLPDLFSQALLHPLRIYLRTQSITLPLTKEIIGCSRISIAND